MANMNIIIVARDESIARISYNAKARKANALNYQGVVTASTTGATRINALSIVVNTMEQLAEKEITDGPVLVLTLGMVTDLIHNGTALYWLANDGKKSDGTAVNETELELWAKFYELLESGLVRHLIFKDVASVKIPKNPKFAIKMEQRNLNEYVEKAWDRIQVTAPEVEECEDGEII